MKNLWLRLGAGLLASVLLVGGAAVLSSRSGSGHRTDGLFYEASGIHPDTRLLTVDGEPVSAEEYLYWLAYDCEYLTSYVGTIDWEEPLTDDMTFGEYAKTDALETVKMFAVVRRMAAQNGVTLTAEDHAALQAQRAEYVTYYGGEDVYRMQIQLMGISEETFDRINSMYYLLDHLAELAATEGSALCPTAEELAAFGEENGYVTARLLYLSTSGLDEDAVSAQRALAEDYVRQLEAQPDADAAYELLGQLIENLGLDPVEGNLTFSDGDADEALLSAVRALDVNAISGVIEGANGFYVAIRRPLNPSALTSAYFNQQLLSARQNAKVVTGKEYNSIQTGTFYRTLLELRQALADEFAAANG